MFFKIRSSQEILKIRDGTPLEANEILTYIKEPSKRIVARILFFKIRPSQEILKIRDGTPFKNGSVSYFSSNLDVPSNVAKKKRVARILFFKIRPSREILKIRDGTPLEAEEILTYIKKPSKRIESSQEILKIRDGTPLEANEILTYIKEPSKRIVCYFSRKLDVPSNVVQKKRVARILFFKIRPSQEISKIHDGTPFEADEILTYIEKPSNGSVCYFSSKLDVSSNIVHKKRVVWILFFKIRPSQKNLKIRDGTYFEAEEILTYIKKPSKWIVKRVARILFFKIRPSQEISKIRDGTPFEADKILTYIEKPSNGSVCYFSSKLDVSSNVVHKKRVVWILFFKISPSQKILKIRDVARIMFFKIRPSQEISKIRDGTPLEAEEILTYIKKALETDRVARILFFKIRPSQEISKIHDGTPFEADEILTYIEKPSNGSVCYFSSKLDVSSNVVHKKRVVWILFFNISPSQKILKIRDGTYFGADEILTYIKKPSKWIGFLLF
ncbi:hypothetical protein OROHE_026354 [Orobanche hederae]